MSPPFQRASCLFFYEMLSAQFPESKFKNAPIVSNNRGQFDHVFLPENYNAIGNFIFITKASLNRVCIL